MLLRYKSQNTDYKSKKKKKKGKKSLVKPHKFNVEQPSKLWYGQKKQE